MNLAKLRELIGVEVIFRPKPRYQGDYIQDTYNVWNFISEPEDRRFLFMNTRSNHQVLLYSDAINNFQEPNMVILHGQTHLQDGGEVIFEPYAQGLMDNQTAEVMVDEALASPIAHLYRTLKSHVDKEVTISFLDSWKTDGEKAVIIKCTPSYVNLRKPAIDIVAPEWMEKERDAIWSQVAEEKVKRLLASIPSKEISVPLCLLQLSEDIGNGTLRLVFDRAFWDGRK